MSGGVGSASRHVSDAIAALQVRLREKDDEISKLKHQLQTEMRQRDIDLDHHKSVERSLRLQLKESIQSVNSRHQIEVDQLKRTHMQSQYEMSDIIADYRAKLAASQDAVEELGSALQSARRQVQSRDSEMQSVQGLMSKVEQEVRGIQNKNDNIRGQLEEYQTMSREEAQRADEFSSKYARAMKDLNHAQDQHRSSQELCQDLRRQLEHSNSRIVKLQDEIQNFEIQLESTKDTAQERLVDCRQAEADKAKLEQSLRSVMSINEDLLKHSIKAASSTGSVHQAQPGKSVTGKSGRPKSATSSASKRALSVGRPTSASAAKPTLGGLDHSIQELRTGIQDEIKQLRRQYKDISNQLRTASGNYDVTALNLALRNLVAKVEKKATHLKLLDRMTIEVSSIRKTTRGCCGRI